MKFKIETENTELKKIQFQTCKNSSFRTVTFTGQELEFLQGIYTNNNNTKSINIKSDDEFFRIKKSVDLDDFENEDKIILEDVIRELYYCEDLKINNKNISNSDIRNKLRLLNKQNLNELINIKNKTSNIKNLPRYLAICLYNLLGNIRNLNIKSKFEFEREDPPEFFDTMYVN